MEVRSKKTFGNYVKTAITAVFTTGIVILVIYAIWANTTINEKIFIFLVVVIFGLVMYILKLKSDILKLKNK